MHFQVLGNVHHKVKFDKPTSNKQTNRSLGSLKSLEHQLRCQTHMFHGAVIFTHIWVSFRVNVDKYSIQHPSVTRWYPPDVMWMLVYKPQYEFVIINHSEIGVMFTNLAKSLTGAPHCMVCGRCNFFMGILLCWIVLGNGSPWEVPTENWDHCDSTIGKHVHQLS